MLDFVCYPVSAILWLWHTAFAFVFGPASGVSWVLAVIFLVLTLGLVLFSSTATWTPNPPPGQNNSLNPASAPPPEPGAKPIRRR